MARKVKNSDDIIKDMKDYYGKKLKGTDDLQTSACTTGTQTLPKHMQKVLSLVHDEVISKYYGCGLAVPDCLENLNVLDLGSGSGRDCYALSSLVGKDGHVIGVDMTDEQLEIANRHIDYHTKVFGYEKSNVKFLKGYIENLEELGIEDNSIDILVSNCVINLCPDKKKVFAEAYRVLKYGGELYFSDVYGEKELPQELKTNTVLWGEGITGALQWEKLFEIAKEVGFEQPRAVKCSPYNICKPALKELVGDAKFVSVVYRMFKLPKEMDTTPCKVTYNGSVTACEERLKFDWRNTFENGKAVEADGNICAILKKSRFSDAFAFDKLTTSDEKSEPVENPFEILASTQC